MYREQAPLDVHRIWGRVKYSSESGLNLQEGKAGGSRKVLEAPRQTRLGLSFGISASLWDLCQVSQSSCGTFVRSLSLSPACPQRGPDPCTG